ncbi:hypothetical protein H2203_005587 [Taxawa tesnikishii (nom. ined.)]|nr:hypothetical protein H2203_005587 [Dothideales sp. JES 119]
MVSFDDSIAAVRAATQAHDRVAQSHEATAAQHAEILRRHEESMREHERNMIDHRRAVRERRQDRERGRRHHRRAAGEEERRETNMRFRFKEKDGAEKRTDGDRDRRRRHRGGSAEEDLEREERRRRKKHRHHHRSRSRSRHKSRSRSGTREGVDLDRFTAHPLPRQPSPPPCLDPSGSASASPYPQPASDDRGFTATNDDAFRASLFDAIADDEGAAYWEGVYSQPIHIYTRPTVVTESGETREMDDEQYVDYVKRKMWERKNPHLVREREERERREQERLEQEQEARGRGRERGRRRREEMREEAWEEDGWEGETFRERESGGRAKGAFMADVDEALRRGSARKAAKAWTQAWASYQGKWKELKDSTSNRATPLTGRALATAVPWPVLKSDTTPVNAANIEEVRWHPDKIQHRFGGENVDKETLKLVTSVFQTVDELVATERRRSGKD